MLKSGSLADKCKDLGELAKDFILPTTDGRKPKHAVSMKGNLSKKGI